MGYQNLSDSGNVEKKDSADDYTSAKSLYFLFFKTTA